MTEDVTYAVEDDLSPAEFIDVLRRSGLGRPNANATTWATQPGGSNPR